MTKKNKNVTILLKTVFITKFYKKLFWFYSTIKNVDEINVINQFVEEFNKIENNNIIVEFSNLFELNDRGRMLRYYCYPKGQLK